MLQKYLNKKWFLAIILICSFLSGILISATGFAVYHVIVTSSAYNHPSTVNSFAKATPAPINQNNPEKGIYNALLLGYGGGNHEGTDLTDSIIVLHVNTNTKNADLISIPRDLWVPGNQKINSVGAISGFANVGAATTNVTGLPINYYVAIDFDEYSKLVDNLGGITIIMPNTLDDPYYPIIGQENNTCGFTDAQIFDLKNKYGQSGFDLEKQFTCRYEHLQYQQGQKYNIDGATALKIARSRHGDSDFARSLRQFAELQGIMQKLISLRSLNKLDNTVSTLFSMVKTDLDLGTIKSLSEVFGDPGLYKINQIQLTSDNVLQNSTSSDGEFILVPKAGNQDFTQVKNYINQNL
ncbi:MAG TPA: LCP family protein [Patescibacteria group bacterium]|nr:LCP family protein [Patescibacteria group bacterium]